MSLSGRANAIGGDEAWDNKLIPTGIARVDYENLKNAIARGGTIRLMSADRMSGATYFNLVDRENPFPAIEITKDINIVGQNTKIVYNREIFFCRSALKISIRNVHFSMLEKNTPFPVGIEKPANDADVTLNLLKVTMGNDDPWD